ncbi:MAG: hypothetical protein H3C71_01350 [Flavobacteriales bacterium]|nr:hypothetical protein [Flavobacteriales bacterium]
MNQISGIHLPQDICLQILTSLGFHITYKDEKLVTVTVPSAKVDVRREVDLVEEILRIYGYDKIPLGNTLTAVLKNEPELPLRTYRNKTAEFLISNGFNESVTLSLDHSIYYPSSNELVFVENPISSELDIMRPTLLFSMLKSAAHNINRRSTRLRFFEFGRTYIKKASNPYAEKPMLGLLMTGEEHPDAWYHTKQKVDFHSIYGVCTSILSKVGVNQGCLEINKQPPFYYETAFNSYADEKKTTLLYTCGKIAAAVLKKIDIKQEIWFAEIHWNHILENISFHYPHFTDLPKFPLVIRDLAMLIDLSVSYKQIENLVRKLFNEKLYDLTLFDVYEGKNIPKGKKSYAIRLTLYNAEKTFTDKEVDEMIQQLITTLTQSLGAEIRSNL